MLNSPRPDPFRSPRPPVEHRPHSMFGGETVHRRTPAEVREAMDRRVCRWFGKAFDAVPAETSREDMIACVFGIHGWQTRARVCQPDQRWPMHGWLLAHPDHGLVVYADKTRPGDVTPGRLAVSRGAWGGIARLTWGEDLADLLDKTVPACPPVPYPHVRTSRALAAHAYRTASAEQRARADLLLGLTGPTLPLFLAQVEADDLSVSPG